MKKHDFILVCPLFKSHLFAVFSSTEDAEVIFSDAGKLGMVGKDWAWIVTEQAFAADNVPIGKNFFNTLITH